MGMIVIVIISVGLLAGFFAVLDGDYRPVVILVGVGLAWLLLSALFNREDDSEFDGYTNDEDLPWNRKKPPAPEPWEPDPGGIQISRAVKRQKLDRAVGRVLDHADRQQRHKEREEEIVRARRKTGK